MNRGAAEVGVTDVAIAGFDKPGVCAPGSVKKDGVYTCTADAHVPNDAKLTTPYFSDEYWRRPSNPAIDIFEPGAPFESRRSRHGHRGRPPRHTLSRTL